MGSRITSFENLNDEVILRPGITGLYRLNANNVSSINKKCDFYYLENYSIFLDIEILFKSILSK